MVDLTPLRVSRDLRLLTAGELVSGLGTQAALVALPYQLYTQTGSAFLVGLLGAVELVPLVTMALLGVGAAYTIDAVSCLAMVAAVVVMAPQPPQTDVVEHPPVLRSIADGLRYVRGNQALVGSFAIDLVAMTFGMPRALFAVLAVSVYHAGAEGTGLLYAAVSAGATVAALTTGWIEHARKLGVIVIWAVVVWGTAIAGVGMVGSLWPAAVLLAIAGAADSVSAVCRSSINQMVTPDAMRGRMSSVFSLVVTSGPRLGDVEAGAVASLTSARFSVASGGIACVVCAGLVVAAFPALARYDKDEALAAL